MHFDIFSGQQKCPTSISSNHQSVLESRARSRFPPLCLKQPEDEWYSIPLETIQNLHESIPRRIQAVLQANGGPTPYYCVCFTAVSIIFVHPLYMLPGYIPWDKLCRNVSLSVGVLFNSLPYLCSVMLLDGFVLLTCFLHNHFLLHSTRILRSCL